MTNVIVTGVTGKSGRFFYEELRSNAKALSDYAFYFIVRDRQKAEKLLTAEGLNQTICVGSVADTEWVSSVFESIIGGGTITLLHIAGIMLSEKLVEVAVRHNVNRLILVHTTGIY